MIKLDLPGNIAALANEKNWYQPGWPSFFMKKSQPTQAEVFHHPGKLQKKNTIFAEAFRLKARGRAGLRRNRCCAVWRKLWTFSSYAVDVGSKVLKMTSRRGWEDMVGEK